MDELSPAAPDAVVSYRDMEVIRRRSHLLFRDKDEVRALLAEMPEESRARFLRMYASRYRSRPLRPAPDLSKYFWSFERSTEGRIYRPDFQPDWMYGGDCGRHVGAALHLDEMDEAREGVYSVFPHRRSRAEERYLESDNCYAPPVWAEEFPDNVY